MTNETRAEIATRLRAIADAIEAGADPSELDGVHPMTWIEGDDYETHHDYGTAVTSAEEALPDAPEWAVEETEVGIYIVMQRGEVYNESEGDTLVPQWARRLVSL